MVMIKWLLLKEFHCYNSRGRKYQFFLSKEIWADSMLEYTFSTLKGLTFLHMNLADLD